MVSKVSRLGDARFWMRVFAYRCRSCHGMEEREIGEVVDCALAFAARAQARYDFSSVNVLLKNDRVTVEHAESAPIEGVRSDYCWEATAPSRIVVYRQELVDAVCTLGKMGFEADWEALFNLCVAHEAFHHLVHTGRVSVPACCRLRIPLRKRLYGKALASTIEELAAHTYASTVTAFPLHSVALDWLCLFQKNRAEAVAMLR